MQLILAVQGCGDVNKRVVLGKTGRETLPVQLWPGHGV
jgi:hypothetical protein